MCFEKTIFLSTPTPYFIDKNFIGIVKGLFRSFDFALPWFFLLEEFDYSVCDVFVFGLKLNKRFFGEKLVKVSGNS